MSRNQNLVAIGLLLALAAATMIWLQMRGGEDPTDAPIGSGSAGTGSASAAVAGSGSAVAKPRVRRLADKGGRDELLRQIREVKAKRTAAANRSSSGNPTAAPTLPTEPTLEKQYIRASVRELIPLLAECYEEGLGRNATLAGSIVVNFTIEGEPDVGGVIGESTIDTEASTLPDPAVRECIQETMYAIEIEPPAGGGVVKVRYPFEFRPAESDAPN